MGSLAYKTSLKRQSGFTLTTRVDLHDDKYQTVTKGGMQRESSGVC
jgi:hypothetical protein